ncbi:MAG: molybdopterin molybdotransferase MoeA [Candidatus Hadarchaeales archaeon]
MQGSEARGGFPRYTRLAQALTLIREKLRRLPSEKVALEESFNRVSACNIYSNIDLPPFDRAAMDGYAVRAQDTRGASELHPARLRVISRGNRIRAKEAVAIATGEPLPLGSDAVVPVERTRREGDAVLVMEPIAPWENVSRKGEDVRAGEVIVREGKRLGPAEVGLLAACGYVEVEVVKRPSVFVIPTGGELTKPGKPLEPGKIYECNSYSIRASLLSCGAVPHVSNPVEDDVGVLKRALRRGAVHDMSLVLGGSSVGDKDLVASAIAEEGELFFHGVAIRPGSPTAFGFVHGKPVFSLPGFPAGCLVAFDLLVRPALQRMLGWREEPRKITAKLGRKVASVLGRVDVVRVKVEEVNGEQVAFPIRVTGSSVLSSLSKADGYLLIPEDIEKIEEGVQVEVIAYR